MKYTLTLAAIAAFAAAQTITDLPSCSLQCVASGVTGVGCELTDFECSCKKADELTPKVTPCVQQACPDAADQQKVISTLEGICASAGFPITVPEPEASSTAVESSEAPSVETSIPTPSATDIVITSPTGYPTGLPTETPEESCAVTTVTVTEIMTKPTAPGVSPPPYPTGSAKPSVPAPSGTGAYTTSPPLFTGAAAAVRVPAGIAGVLGLAAFVF
ncbi:hypothetical protein BU26DRAFT_563363 [Trematosphaeria pertusa]|uniref:CFEM domain-containing protein n=1 Tax=Trematosphaeria pertusa TaxID=390896 RepID=A0A6A6ILZ2_9PLEO|nr:uncharacterized protein BU26DRAFT_563363 [Trematosphaeria pertusa]KAF2251426.1 hypothetical protein BU26DRAFT_563363 [Trematosphaeria pertusa]